MLPFDHYCGGGRKLLGPPPFGDGTARHGYGPPVFRQCGTVCVYCGRDLGSTYGSWLHISVDHVVPGSTVQALGYPPEWVHDTTNLVTCCRACNEFLNGYRVTEPPPQDVQAFFDLRDRVFYEKREHALRRHEREEQSYTRWRDETPAGPTRL